MVLLLAGVIVGVVLTAIADLLTLVSPEALRNRQIFLLGSTSFLGWSSVAALALVLALALPLAMRVSRLLDALVLGEATAQSLGLPVARLLGGRRALPDLTDLFGPAATSMGSLTNFTPRDCSSR